jgi:protein SHQ1
MPFKLLERLGLTIASDDVMVSLGKHILRLEMKKGSIGWNLEQLEAAADREGAEERDSDSDDETSDGNLL